MRAPKFQLQTTRLSQILMALLLTMGLCILTSFKTKIAVGSEFLPSQNSTNQTKKWGLPTLNPGEKITQHSAYTVSYNHKHMQANWVAYELRFSNTQGLAERESRFIVDPIILPRTARTEDYTKSGFDRGHLAPAADMKYSSQAMAESFYTSNISPQTPGLNRGIWKKLEEKIRTWAPANRPLFIVTGPVLKDTLTHFIGRYNRVTVPNRFFKVLLDTAQPARAIGFVFANQNSALPLSAFALSIDAIEKMTGIDFFSGLSDTREISIEKSAQLQRWNFN